MSDVERRTPVALSAAMVVVFTSWAGTFAASVVGLIDWWPAELNSVFMAAAGMLVALHNPQVRDRAADTGRELRAYLTSEDRAWLRSQGWTDEDGPRP